MSHIEDYQSPPKITEAERDIKYDELGKVGINRHCLLKDSEGWYCDGNLQQVMDRNSAPVYKCSKLFGLDLVKPLTFELLVPQDALTGGPELQEVVCYAESQRQEDRAQFLVRYVKPDAVTGYSYCGTPKASRANAFLMDRKEVRRMFNDIPKSEIIIELLKPQPISKLADFFNQAAIDLIKAAPKNESVRGFMLSKLKVMPPMEADTLEKLKEWIEWNVGKPGTRSPVLVGAPDATAIDQITMPITVRRSYTSFGTCNYSCRKSGNQTIHIAMADIAQMAEGANSWADLRGRILRFVEDSDDDADYELNKANATYSEFDQGDSYDPETEWPSVSTADQAIKSWLREHYPAALARFNLT